MGSAAASFSRKVTSPAGAVSEFCVKASALFGSASTTIGSDAALGGGEAGGDAVGVSGPPSVVEPDGGGGGGGAGEGCSPVDGGSADPGDVGGGEAGGMPTGAMSVLGGGGVGAPAGSAGGPGSPP